MSKSQYPGDCVVEVSHVKWRPDWRDQDMILRIEFKLNGRGSRKELCVSPIWGLSVRLERATTMAIDGTKS